MKYPIRLAMRILLLFVLATGFMPRVWSATVYLKEKQSPVCGTIIKQNEKSIVIRQATAEGKPTKEVTLDRSDIEELFLPVDTNRLEKLSPTSPQEYRLYAEELAQHRADPEAAAMAIELYLRAAQLETGGARESSLRGLIGAARSSAEKRRFAATAIAVCSTLPLNILGEVGGGIADATVPTSGGNWSRYIDFVHSVRHGRGPGSTPQGQVVLDSFPQFLLPAGFSMEDLAAVAKKSVRPNGSTLRDVLLLEAKLVQEQSTPADSNADGLAGMGYASVSWERESSLPHRFVPLPESLQDLTTSDLKATIYRQGKWVRP